MSRASASQASVRDPEYMTYEEFLEAPGPEWAEWVDGRMVPMPNVSLLHYRTTDWLSDLIKWFNPQQRFGNLLGEPFNMKTGPDLPGRSPDLFFLLNDNAHRLRDNHLDGPADIVVEVASPSTEAVDRGEKFYEYEAGGVREYWLIDPHRRIAEFHRLNADGHYQAVAAEDGYFSSDVLPGLRFRVEWLWSRPDISEIASQLQRP